MKKKSQRKQMSVSQISDWLLRVREEGEVSTAFNKECCKTPRFLDLMYLIPVLTQHFTKPFNYVADISKTLLFHLLSGHQYHTNGRTLGMIPNNT